MVDNYSTKTKILIIFVSLGLTYAAASWAIDSGSLIAHVLAIGSVYIAFYFLISLFKRSSNEPKK